MVSRRNGTGFGHFGWGHSPFGKADYGLDVIRRSMPESYLVDDDNVENELLAHYLQTIEDSNNRVKSFVDKLDEQVDFAKVRVDLLPFLGSTIDIIVDDSEPEEFQRALVGNAIQYYQIKGTRQAFRIRGKISGFDTEIENLYKLAPDLVSSFSIDDLFEIPPKSNVYYTVLPPNSVSGTPTEVSCDYCLTSYIKLNFSVVKTQPPSIIGEGNFFDRLVYKLKEIIPIHVRDLLYELKATIVITNDFQENVSSHEMTMTPTPFFYRFDYFSADTVPCDWRGAVSGFNETT